MAEATLRISGRGEERAAELDPKGTVLGRSPACDVVLDSGRVSRRHAMVFRDPFGRWIVQDVGSRHGVWVQKQRIEARAVLPGEPFHIGPFSVAISEETDRQIDADPSAEQMVRAITAAAEEFRKPLPQQDDVTALALLYRGPQGAAG